MLFKFLIISNSLMHNSFEEFLIRRTITGNYKKKKKIERVVILNKEIVTITGSTIVRL